MIAAWMVYALLVGALFGAAAVALEAGFRKARLPGRWIYVAAMAAGTIVPVVMRAPPAGPMAVSGPSGGVNDPGSISPIVWTIPQSSGFGNLDAPLVMLWIGATAVALTILIGTQTRILRTTRTYRSEAIDGTQVLRSSRFGPAVVGWWKGSIVLPAWVDALEHDWRRMVLLHETEHQRRGDSQLLFAALILAALVPWNISLWWMVLRLRASIELDCDRRVLASGVDVRAYGNLLLDMSMRRSLPGFALVGFSVTRPFLARRFDTIADHVGRARYMAAGLASVAGLGLVVLACAVPSPIPADGEEQQVLREVYETPTDSAANFEHGPVLLPDTTVPVMRVLEFLDAVAQAGDLHMAVDTMALANVPDEVLEHLKATAVLMQVLEKDGKPTVLMRELESRSQEQLRRIAAIQYGRSRR